MKVLILGAGGQVGRALAASCPSAHGCVALDRAALNICDGAAVQAVFKAGRFDWAINAAAYTQVDAAETDPAGAAAVNAQAVGLIADAAGRTRTRLLHFSTDFVFDGRSAKAYLPASEPNPLSVYGKTKLAGERAVLGGAGGIVLRTSWVYAAAGRNFVLTMLKLMQERDAIRVVRDQIGSPTWAGGLAAAVWALLTLQAPPGIYHWSDQGVASWYDFAAAIQDEALACGLLAHRIPITPIRSEEYPTQAVRPAFSVLDSESTQALTRLPPVHWRESLRMMLQELRATR